MAGSSVLGWLQDPGRPPLQDRGLGPHLAAEQRIEPERASLEYSAEPEWTHDTTAHPAQTQALPASPPGPCQWPVGSWYWRY